MASHYSLSQVPRVVRAALPAGTSRVRKVERVRVKNIAKGAKDPLHYQRLLRALSLEPV